MCCPQRGLTVILTCSAALSVTSWHIQHVCAGNVQLVGEKDSGTLASREQFVRQHGVWNGKPYYAREKVNAGVKRYIFFFKGNKQHPSPAWVVGSHLGSLPFQLSVRSTAASPDAAVAPGRFWAKTGGNSSGRSQQSVPVPRIHIECAAVQAPSPTPRKGAQSAEAAAHVSSVAQTKLAPCKFAQVRLGPARSLSMHNGDAQCLGYYRLQQPASRRVYRQLYFPYCSIYFRRVSKQWIIARKPWQMPGIFVAAAIDGHGADASISPDAVAPHSWQLVHRGKHLSTRAPWVDVACAPTPAPTPAPPAAVPTATLTMSAADTPRPTPRGEAPAPSPAPAAYSFTESATRVQKLAKCIRTCRESDGSDIARNPADHSCLLACVALSHVPIRETAPRVSASPVRDGRRHRHEVIRQKRSSPGPILAAARSVVRALLRLDAAARVVMVAWILGCVLMLTGWGQPSAQSIEQQRLHAQTPSNAYASSHASEMELVSALSPATKAAQNHGTDSREHS